MFGIRDAEMMRAVARSNGFRAAAQELGLSQSAVSNRIGALEKKLGILLFDRSRRQVRLTPQGRRFLEEAERLVGLRDRIASRFSQAQVSGTLRLGVSETIAHTQLPAIVRALHTAEPGLRIELTVDTSQSLAERLVRDEVDMAALLRPFTPSQAKTRALGAFTLGWYAKPGLVDADEPATRERLAAHPILTFSRDTLPYREVERLLTSPELDAPLLHGSASLSTVMTLAADGLGVATLPDVMAAPAVTEGRIVRIAAQDDAALSDLEFALCAIADSDDRFGQIADAVDAA